MLTKVFNILLFIVIAVFLSPCFYPEVNAVFAYDGASLFNNDISKKIQDIVTEKLRKQVPATSKPGNNFRILAYNIAGKNHLSASALSKIVKNINADFAFLTEAVSGNILYPNQPSAIGRAGNFPHIVFKANIRIWTYLEKMGNAILSKSVLYDSLLKDLPKIRKESELRGIAASRTKINGREIALICAHLSRTIHKDERIKQIEYIADLVKSTYRGVPVILAGDFNTTPSEADVLKPLTDIMDDGFLYLAGVNKLSPSAGATIPSNKPDVKFDYIFFSKGHFNIKSFQVYASTVSDHRPFIVDAELK